MEHIEKIKYVEAKTNPRSLGIFSLSSTKQRKVNCDTVNKQVQAKAHNQNKNKTKFCL